MRKRKNKPNEEDQLQCAKIIAAHPEKYAGTLQEWAQRVLKSIDSKPAFEHSEDDGKPPW